MGVPASQLTVCFARLHVSSLHAWRYQCVPTRPTSSHCDSVGALGRGCMSTRSCKHTTSHYTASTCQTQSAAFTGSLDRARNHSLHSRLHTRKSASGLWGRRGGGVDWALLRLVSCFVTVLSGVVCGPVLTVGALGLYRGCTQLAAQRRLHLYAECAERKYKETTETARARPTPNLSVYNGVGMDWHGHCR